MPFKSKKQQRFMYAKKPKGVDLEEWAKETDFKKLPEKAKKKADIHHLVVVYADTTSDEPHMYEEAGSDKAQPEVQKAVERFRELSEEERDQKPLLYWLLGAGTPPYKAAPEDADYTDESKSEEKKCSTCRFAYKKVIKEDYYICSQIRGEIRPDGWCKWWHK